MGKAIVEALVPVLIAVIAASVIIYFRRRQSKETALDKGWAIKGDLNSRQERAIVSQMASAANIFRELLAPPSVDPFKDITLLRQEDREKVQDWLNQYSNTTDSIMRSFIRKGIPPS